MQSYKYTWLFGENVGATANNNSYYFWDQIVAQAKQDGIGAYFILEKTDDNAQFASFLPREKKSMIVWRNSAEHHLLFEKADMLFVTLSYLDVTPDKFRDTKVTRYAEAPVIYLQHGILGMKTIGYNSHSYNNNMFRFIYYNRTIEERLLEVNKFKPYQLYYGQYPPRFKELVRKAELNARLDNGKKRILWFLTWREYKDRSIQDKLFMGNTLAVLKSEKLHQYLQETNTTMTVVVHQLASKRLAEQLDLDDLAEVITVKPATETNVMDELVRADALITDYSSVAFDFTFLGKPMALYQPDFGAYSRTRKFYYDKNELKAVAFAEPLEFVDSIVDGTAFATMPLFRQAFPDVIDYSAVKRGKHIERMYKYFLDIQRHTITFLGYGFWGIGGTVTATRALAESLLERGYAVQLLSLKKLQFKAPTSNPPGGLRFNAFYISKRTKGKVERAKRKIWRSKRHFNIIPLDRDIENLIPYAAWALKRYLNTSNASVIVSTRESFHHALKVAKTDAEKLYFFHTTANAIEDYFPGLAADMAKEGFGKSLFTTDANRKLVEENLGIKLDSTLVLGNTLEASSMMTLEDVLEARQRKLDKMGPKQFINCATLLRVSAGREQDLANIIEFGLWLKQHGIYYVKLNIYGSGDLIDDFIDYVIADGLQDIIKIKGRTTKPIAAIKRNDIVVDFAEEQSFGMTYLEAVFNGMVPLCKRNTGSSEVLAGCEDLFYDSWEELMERLLKYRNCLNDVFQPIYETVYERYSHEALSTKFLDFAFGGSNLDNTTDLHYESADF